MICKALDPDQEDARHAETYVFQHMAMYQIESCMGPKIERQLYASSSHDVDGVSPTFVHISNWCTLGGPSKYRRVNHLLTIS